MKVTYDKIARIAFPLFAVITALLLILRISRDRPPPPNSPAPPIVTYDAAPAPKPVEHDTKQTKQAFDEIYKDSKWGLSPDGVGKSGTGSTLHATLLYRTFLGQFLEDNKIKSVVDAGCGDWEFSQHIDWTGIQYTGYDIVPTVIEANKKRFAKPNIEFVNADIVETDLPKADLLISKHVLQHLPNAAVAKLVKQFDKYEHVLLTNGVDGSTLTAANTDIKPGEYRYIDLTKPPFNLTATKLLTYKDAAGDMHQVLYIRNPKPQ